MWIEVRSPHSGRPVRIREKDVGRTVRDEEGKVFYVLPTSDGEGHYASLTRTGGEDQEDRYFQMIEKEGHAKAVAAGIHQQQVHDATGKRRRPATAGKLLFLVIALAVVVLALLYLGGYPPFDTAAPRPAPDPGTQDVVPDVPAPPTPPTRSGLQPVEPAPLALNIAPETHESLVSGRLGGD